MNRLKVGDLVQIMTGKDRGMQGKITKILREDDKVVVEGLNMITRHQRPNARNEQCGKITREAPLQASNVMPIDPGTGKPTRVKIRVGDDGKKTRVGKSGAPITTG